MQHTISSYISQRQTNSGERKRNPVVDGFPFREYGKTPNTYICCDSTCETKIHAERSGDTFINVRFLNNDDQPHQHSPNQRIMDNSLFKEHVKQSLDTNLFTQTKKYS